MVNLRVAINALAVDRIRPGGDGTYVRELTKHLVLTRDDTQYTLFVTAGSASLLPPARPRVRQVVCPLAGRSLVARVLWEQLALPRYIREASPDVFHAPVNVAPIGNSARLILTLLEAEPFMPHSKMPLALRAYWRALRSASARAARRVLAISQVARGELVRYMRLPESKVGVVHLGVDTARFRPDPAASRENYILWVGRSYPRKNLVRLVEAYAQLGEQLMRRHPLVLVGVPGWAHTPLQDRVHALGLGDRILFVGRASDYELLTWYQRARLFVFPSLHEAFGLPVLEALATGTPVVAADIPALREVAAEAAEYVDPTQTQSIVRGIQLALEDPHSLARARSRGLQRAQLFDWDNVARETHQAYVAAAS